MEYQSISQGIFFRKPKKSGNAAKEDEALAVKYFEGFSPPVATAEIRSKLYKKHLTKFRGSLQSLKKSWFEEVVTQVFQYVSSSNKSVIDFQGAITPIAFVITGMPGDENKELLQAIHVKLQGYSPHVASISSKMDLNVKVAFQYLCQQLMDNDLNNFPADFGSTEDEDEPECPTRISTKRRVIKRISANDLKSWYETAAQSPVIICVEDIDLFPVKTVQSLIMAFSCIKLPVVFVAGITSCCENFDSFVPQKCPTTFVYKTFTPLPPESRLGEFMELLLRMEDSPFLLSGEVIAYMSKIFLFEEFSVTRLEQIFRLCLLEHYRLPESVLCADFRFLEERVLKPNVMTAEVIKSTFASESETIKTAPRMKLNSKTNGHWAVENYISSPKKTTVRQAGIHLGELETQVLSFRNRQLEWKIYQQFLFALVKNLPGLPSCFSSLHNLYIMCFSGAIFEPIPEDERKECPMEKVMNMLNVLARSQLERQLKRGLRVLSKEADRLEEAGNEKTDIPYLMGRVEAHLEKLEKVDQEERKAAEQAAKAPKKIKSHKSHFEFLQDMKERAEQSGSVYSKLRESIVKELRKDSKTFLMPLRNLPFSKAFIYDDLEFLQEMVTPNTHKRIHAALIEPEKFLKCEHCKDDSGEHIRSDLAIVYSLILEQQMLNVNLNVIFESFRAQVEDPAPYSDVSTPKKRKTAATKASEKQALLIRFRQAVAELQHMGFIKHSRSKIHTDEVTRLHFGF